jgi:hypothetical protein
MKSFKSNDVTMVKKQNLKNILDHEKVLYSKRTVRMVFPFKFTYSMPLISYSTINLYEFLSIDFDCIEYVFEYYVADVMIESIFDLETKLKNIQNVQLARLTFTRAIAYHIICINNLAIYHNEFLSKTGKFRDINELHCYGVYHLMALENMLPINRLHNIEEMTITEGHEIISNCKRKLWNLFISVHYFPKLFIADFIKNLIVMREIHGQLTKLNDHQRAFMMLSLKGDRLVRDFIRYYIAKIRYYPDFAPVRYYDDFIMVSEKVFIKDFFKLYPNLLPLFVKHNLADNNFVLLNTREECEE